MRREFTQPRVALSRDHCRWSAPRRNPSCDLSLAPLRATYEVKHHRVPFSPAIESIAAPRGTE